MTSNWQLHGQLARTARGTESRGAVAVLLAQPAAGCTPRCVGGGFAQTAPSLGSGRAEMGGWPPTAAIAPWPHPGASHLQRAALGSSQRCLTPLQTAFANPPRDPQARQFGVREESPTACLRQLCPAAPALRYSRSTPRAKHFIEHILI